MSINKVDIGRTQPITLLQQPQPLSLDIYSVQPCLTFIKINGMQIFYRDRAPERSHSYHLSFKLNKIWFQLGNEGLHHIAMQQGQRVSSVRKTAFKQGIAVVHSNQSLIHQTLKFLDIWYQYTSTLLLLILAGMSLKNKNKEKTLEKWLENRKATQLWRHTGLDVILKPWSNSLWGW